MTAKRTLYVKPTSNGELTSKWGFPVHFHGDLFARCNEQGNVLWDKTLIYTSKELIEHGKVKILTE